MPDSNDHSLDVDPSATKVRWDEADLRENVMCVQEIRRRLSTWEENDNEDQEDRAEGAVNRGNSRELQHANQCAAELLRTSSLIALGALDSGGQLDTAKQVTTVGRLSGHHYGSVTFGC